MKTQLLVAGAPAEQLLALAIFFGLAALILLALSVEVGNYHELGQWLAVAKRLLLRRRLRHRWYFNMPLANQGDTRAAS